jgi:hypothetical protein
MSIEIRLANSHDRAAILEFVRAFWREDHVFVLEPRVFDWQYLDETGRLNMVIAIRNEPDDENTILGLLGFIPMGKFDQNLADQDIMLALWKVREDISPPGIGLRLLKYIQSQLKPRLIGAIGISAMVGPIYRALGYQLGKLTQAALFNPALQHDLKIAQNVPESAFSAVNGSGSIQFSPLNPDADPAFRQTVDQLTSSYAPAKSWAYVAERYLQHPWYDYTVRAVVEDGRLLALVVWRPVMHGDVRILRIVDIIGSTEWLENAASLFVDELQAVGAEYIDVMQLGIPDKVLQNGGFFSPDWTEGLILPNYFAPFEQRNVDISLAYKIFGPEKMPVYLYRADSDQDRPNMPAEVQSALSGK